MWVEGWCPLPSVPANPSNTVARKTDFLRPKRSPNNSSQPHHTNPLVQTKKANFLYRNLRKLIFRPISTPFPIGIWGREAPESENLSIFTDLVLVRSPCLLGRSRPSIHRWKALVVKEKKKERKEGGREGVWVVFRHQKHGVYAVKTGAEQFMPQGPNPLHVEKRGTSAKTPPPKHPPAWRTGRRQIGQKATFFAPEQTDRPIRLYGGSQDEGSL